MEFDNTTHVSDDQRRLAESKKITLQPVHADITPDDIPASEIAAQHLNAPAIANAENDTEQNVSSIRPSSELLSRHDTDKGSRGFMIAIVASAVGSALLIGSVLFFK